MKKTVQLMILLLICAVYSISYAQNVTYSYMKDIPARADYVADFKEVSDHVNKKYTHLKAKNINGILLQAEYLEFVKNVNTNLEYGELLLRYFATLKNSHTGAIFKKYYKNCSAILVENRVFISYLDDSIFIRNGVNEKDEILKINDIPVLTYLQNQEKYISFSTDLNRTYLAVSSLFSSYFEEKRTYTVKTSSGEKEITVHFDDLPVSQVVQSSNQTIEKVEGKRLNDHVVYIAIQSMTGDVVNEFINTFDSLSNSPFMIIDLRRNSGGNSGYSEKIAEYFISKRQKACVSGRWLTPKSNRFTGKLFVLTSPYTASAAESFLLDISENNDATLVGMPTTGDTGNQPRFYTSDLGYSYWFPSRKKAQISPGKFPMEGESIQPDYIIYKTLADYLENKDTVLEYTLDIIRTIK